MISDSQLGIHYTARRLSQPAPGWFVADITAKMTAVVKDVVKDSQGSKFVQKLCDITLAEIRWLYQRWIPGRAFIIRCVLWDIGIHTALVHNGGLKFNDRLVRMKKMTADGLLINEHYFNVLKLLTGYLKRKHYKG